jgi:hypothetical protein
MSDPNEAVKYEIVAIRSDQCVTNYNAPCELHQDTPDKFFYKCVNGECLKQDGAPNPEDILCDPNISGYCFHYECRDQGKGYKECIKFNIPGNSTCSPNGSFEQCNSIIPTHYECDNGECIEKTGAGINQCDPSIPGSCGAYLACIPDPISGGSICRKMSGSPPPGTKFCSIEGTRTECETTIGTYWKCAGNQNGSDCRCEQVIGNNPDECDPITNKPCCTPPSRKTCIDINDQGDKVCRSIEEYGLSDCNRDENCLTFHKECVLNHITGLKDCINVEGIAPDQCQAHDDCRDKGAYVCRDGNCVWDPNTRQPNECYPGIDTRKCQLDREWRICAIVNGEHKCITIISQNSPGGVSCTYDSECVPRTRKVCRNNLCVEEIGAGPDECNTLGEDTLCAAPIIIPTAQCSLHTICEKDFGNVTLAWNTYFSGIGMKDIKFYYKVGNNPIYTYWRSVTERNGTITFTEQPCCTSPLTFKMIATGIDNITKTTCTSSTYPRLVSPRINISFSCPNIMITVSGIQSAEVLGYELYWKEVLEGQTADNVEWTLIENINSTQEQKLYDKAFWDSTYKLILKQNPYCWDAPFATITYIYPYVNAYSTFYAKLVYKKSCYTDNIQTSTEIGCCPKAKLIEVPIETEICQKTRRENFTIENGQTIVDTGGELKSLTGTLAQNYLMFLNTGCNCQEGEYYDNKFFHTETIKKINIITNDFQDYNRKPLIDIAREIVEYCFQYKRTVQFDIWILRLQNICDPDNPIFTMTSIAGTDIEFIRNEWDVEWQIKYIPPETEIIRNKLNNYRVDIWTYIDIAEGTTELNKITNIFLDRNGPTLIEPGNTSKQVIYDTIKNQNIELFVNTSNFWNDCNTTKIYDSSSFSLTSAFAIKTNHPNVTWAPENTYEFDCASTDELSYPLIDINKITYHFLDDNLTAFPIDTTKKYKVSFILELSIGMKDKWESIVNNINAFIQMMNLANVDVSYNISILHNISNEENSIGYDILGIQSFYDTNDGLFTKNGKYIMDQIRTYKFFSQSFENIALWNCMRDIHKTRIYNEKSTINDIEIYVPIIDCKNFVNYDGAQSEVTSYYTVFPINTGISSNYPPEKYMKESLMRLEQELHDLMAYSKFNMRIEYLYNGGEAIPERTQINLAESGIQFHYAQLNQWSSLVQFDPKNPHFVTDPHYYAIHDFFDSWWHARIKIKYLSGHENIYKNVKFVPNWLTKAFKLGKI